MATRSSVGLDGLKNTLDTLQLDPSIREEREYLASVLRRLGYTEVQIQQALGPAQDEEPVEEAQEEPADHIEIEVDEAEIPLYEIVEGISHPEEFREVEEEEELLFPLKEDVELVELDPDQLPDGTKALRLTVLGAHAQDDLEDVPLIDAGARRNDEDEEPERTESTGRRGQRMMIIEASSAEEAMRLAREQGHRVRGATKLRVSVAEDDEEFQKADAEAHHTSYDEEWEEVQ